MVTNIDFTSQEITEKRSFSGNTALITSVALVVFVFLLYLGVIIMKQRYISQQRSVEAEISQEQSKARSAEFFDTLDFQDRLNLLEKTIDNHPYWDSLLTQMGSYVIPEVRLTSFSGKMNAAGGAEVEISATAPNLNDLSRELILLKSMPGLDALEFKGTGGQVEQKGFAFNVGLKVNKSAFQK